MATQTVPDSDTRTIPLARINVAEGHNPRTVFDGDELSSLAESIRTHGLVTPLLVAPDPDVDGEFRLVAGERRYRACGEAALTEVPVVVRTTVNGDALDLAIVENLHREDLNPIDEARAFQRALESGGTQAELAERLSITPKRVSEALRLLRLPEAVQEHIAAGALPTSVAKALIKMAKVSEPVAVAVADLMVGTDADVAGLADNPGELVQTACDGEDGPPCVAAQRWQRHYVGDLPLPADKAEALLDQARELAGGDEPTISFSDEDVDAARAYGCLLEFDTESWMPSAFICDPEFLADRIQGILEAHAKAQDEADHAAPEPGEGEREAADRVAAAAEREREQRKAERDAEAQDRIEARGANLELGRKAGERFHEPKITRDMARLVALCVLDNETARLAARGLRFVLADWQTEETSTVKSTGQTKTKITYLEPDEAEAALWEWFAKAKSAEQIIGRVVQALVAAHHADPSAVAASRRVPWTVPGTYGTAGPVSEVKTLVEKFARPVLPPRLADQLAEAEARRAEFSPKG